MTARILAIEDDLLHAEALKLEIDKLGHLLIDVVDNASDFRRLVQATLPDLLIVDIDLGDEIDGVQLAEEVTKSKDIPFLFLTSQEDQESIQRATDISPNAYLTKPVNGAALQAAIALAMQNTSGANQKSAADAKVFLLKEADGLKPVALDELLFVEASNKTSVLQLQDEQRETTMKLSTLADQLPSAQFMQVHRSFIIRVDKVQMVDPGYQFVQIEQTKIPVGRKYKENLMQRLLKLG